MLKKFSIHFDSCYQEIVMSPIGEQRGIGQQRGIGEQAANPMSAPKKVAKKAPVKTAKKKAAKKKKK